jgi:hypothetical protein
MKILILIQLLPFLLIGCGGSGSPAADRLQSAGGAWSTQDSNGEFVELLISEVGEVRSTFRVPAVTEAVTFGAGFLEVMPDGSVVGILEAKGIQPSPTAPRPVELSCSLLGTIEERQFLSIQIACSDDSGIVHDETVSLSYGLEYEEDSSLELIAGNFTLAFRPQTNILNINSDGVLFGMYHNGANCTVNGSVSIIDPNYNLVAVEWTMSSCIDPFGIYEGIKMRGFARQIVGLVQPPGSYDLILSGTTEDGFQTFRVFYEPI